MTPSGAVVTQLYRGDGPSERTPDTPKDLGETRAISDVTPFLLNDAERATYVVFGEIDLFLVEVRDSKTYGARHYLCSFKEGDLLFGFDGRDLLTPVGLLAVGSVGAAVSEFPISSLLDWVTKADRQVRVRSMIDCWVEAISEAGSRPLRPHPRSMSCWPPATALSPSARINASASRAALAG